jgi:hypothetical protein
LLHRWGFLVELQQGRFILSFLRLLKLGLIYRDVLLLVLQLHDLHTSLHRVEEVSQGPYLSHSIDNLSVGAYHYEHES